MSRKELKDSVYMGVAREIAKLATCPRAAVGAVLLIDGRVASTGYNGAPAGKPHCIDDGCLVVDDHCQRTVHAEQNVFDYLNDADYICEEGAGRELYCTIAPCLICTKKYLLDGIQPEITGHSEVIYMRNIGRLILPNRMPISYRGAESRELWRAAGIEVTYID